VRAAAVLCVSLAAPLAAQDTQIQGPLRPVADNPTSVLPAPPFPDLLLEAPPAVGLFRSAWLPAGLARDVTAGAGSMRLGVGGASGEYRRPFDPNDVRTIAFRAAGWQPVGTGAAWGRVVAEDVRLGSAGHASYSHPYGSSPLVLADTTNPEAKRVRYTLEGAMGWTLGAWLVGLSGGLEVLDVGTRETQFIRTDRFSAPAVELNVGRDLFAGITLLLHGRWMGGSETVFLRPEPKPSRAYRFSGFEDPLPLDIVPPGAYFRRVQRDGYAGGAALAGRLYGQPWMLSVGRTYRKDIHFEEVRQDPPTDDWVADGWTITAAHQRPLPYGITATLQLDANRLAGDVTLAAVEGVAVGGGCTIAVAADVAYAGEGTRMRLPFANLGLVPEIASSYLLQQNIGRQRAAEIMFTAEWIDAQRALELGLVARVLPQGGALPAMMDKAREMARWPVSALVAIKRTLKTAHEAGIAAARAIEDSEMMRLAGSPENIEAITAFMQKRDPDFKQFRK